MTYLHYYLTIILLLDAACIAVGMAINKPRRGCICLYWLLLTIRYSIEIWGR